MSTALVTGAEEARVTAAMEDRRVAQAAAAQARQVVSNAEPAGAAGGVSSSAHEGAHSSSHAAHPAMPAPPHEAASGGEPTEQNPEVRMVCLPIKFPWCAVSNTLDDMFISPIHRSQCRPSMWMLCSSAPLMVPRTPHTKPRPARSPQVHKQRSSSPCVSNHHRKHHDKRQKADCCCLCSVYLQ